MSSCRVLSTAVVAYISHVATLKDLIQCMPTTHRPRLGELCEELYRVAVKTATRRVALQELKELKQKGTYPGTIATIKPLSVQTCKEFSSHDQVHASRQRFEEAAAAYRDLLLNETILLREAELAHLQSLLSVEKYTAQAQQICREYDDWVRQTFPDQKVLDESYTVPTELASPTTEELALAVFKSVSQFSLVKLVHLWPQQAIALAFASVQKDTSCKLKKVDLAEKVKEESKAEQLIDYSSPAMTSLMNSAVKKALARHNVNPPQKSRQKAHKKKKPQGSKNNHSIKANGKENRKGKVSGKK
ncbi:hypothetical protein BDZ91DRAFT_787114 [Kalaharituber pfeilii]|nr:hypothetical protein BDZ91DRAFT_787114 [Kalaharituber pfeilii]